MDYLFSIKLSPPLINEKQADDELTKDLMDVVHKNGGKVFLLPSSKTSFRNPIDLSPAEWIVSLGSAGVFTAVVQTLHKYLEKNSGREITIERDGQKKTIKVSIKGHNKHEEEELLKDLFPELVKNKRK